MVDLRFLPATVFAATILCWLTFAAIFWLRKKPRKTPERKRDATSRWGIALQGAGYFTVWFFSRPYFTPILPLPRPLEWALAICTIVLAVASVWLVLAAVRTLGKQWAFVARVVEGHKLITAGPYSFVRNPIYLGLFGMLLATGLAVSRWWAIPIALILFLTGNSIRLRSEEKLLRESFGGEFDDYARRVPAMFPRRFSLPKP